MQEEDDMPVKFEWHGDELIRRMQDALSQATGQVSLPELMPSAFMQKHTKFSSLEDMLSASKLAKEEATAEELGPILQSPEWNQFVAANSSFASWQDMIKAAGVERVKKALGN